MRTGSSAAQSALMGEIPDRPASSADQVDATSPPTGVVAPSPVTTTAVVSVMTSGRDARVLDVRNRVLHGAQVLRGLVRDRDAEALLGGDQYLDHRQRVDVEVVDELLLQRDVRSRDAGDLFDDRG